MTQISIGSVHKGNIQSLNLFSLCFSSLNTKTLEKTLSTVMIVLLTNKILEYLLSLCCKPIFYIYISFH